MKINHIISTISIAAASAAGFAGLSGPEIGQNLRNEISSTDEKQKTLLVQPKGMFAGLTDELIARIKTLSTQTSQALEILLNDPKDRNLLNLVQAYKEARASDFNQVYELELEINQYLELKNEVSFERVKKRANQLNDSLTQNTGCSLKNLVETLEKLKEFNPNQIRTAIFESVYQGYSEGYCTEQTPASLRNAILQKCRNMQVRPPNGSAPDGLTLHNMQMEITNILAQTYPETFQAKDRMRWYAYCGSDFLASINKLESDIKAEEKSLRQISK